MMIAKQEWRTDVDVQSTRHAAQQHIHDAEVGRTAVKQGHAVKKQGKCETEFSVVPHTRAAVPDDRVRHRTRWKGIMIA